MWRPLVGPEYTLAECCQCSGAKRFLHKRYTGQGEGLSSSYLVRCIPIDTSNTALLFTVYGCYICGKSFWAISGLQASLRCAGGAKAFNYHGHGTGHWGAFLHSASYYVVYLGNTPENHPPTEACMFNSKPHGVQISGPWDPWQV